MRLSEDNDMDSNSINPNYTLSNQPSQHFIAPKNHSAQQPDQDKYPHSEHTVSQRNRQKRRKWIIPVTGVFAVTIAIAVGAWFLFPKISGRNNLNGSWEASGNIIWTFTDNVVVVTGPTWLEEELIAKRLSSDDILIAQGTFTIEDENIEFKWQFVSYCFVFGDNAIELCRITQSDNVINIRGDNGETVSLTRSSQETTTSPFRTIELPPSQYGSPPALSTPVPLPPSEPDIPIIDPTPDVIPDEPPPVPDEPAPTPTPYPQDILVTEELFDKTQNLGESIVLEVFWSGDRKTTFTRDIHGVWFMYGRDGDNREVNPEFTLRGTTLEIRFPTTTRVYSLYDDYSGIFGEETLQWKYDVN